MDFMLYAMDSVVNQAAKWSYMFAGQAHPGLTIRAIINRGGEQGAQHSQSLHSWFAHIPGLRVVMPSSVADARDLLIASTLCPDPVVYIDDRWLYDQVAELPPVRELDLRDIGPKVIHAGDQLTIFATSYSTFIAHSAALELKEQGISVEVIDGRVINPLDIKSVVLSVEKTGRLLVVDGGWSSCGLSGEVIAGTLENINPSELKSRPRRITLPASPAPTAKILERIYYPDAKVIVECSRKMILE
jgi:pyruvate dehydrogenase E1 component beta subunit